MQAVELIRKKRDGDILSTAEINWLVDQYTQELIPDYQMSALLMSIYWRGMNARETSDLEDWVIRVVQSISWNL